MAEFIARWFTPSQATGESGAEFNRKYNEQQAAARARKKEVKGGPATAKRIKPSTVTSYGGLLDSEQADLAKKQLLGQ